MTFSYLKNRVFPITCEAPSQCCVDIDIENVRFSDMPLQQYSYEQLMFPFADNTPISDAKFAQIMLAKDADDK